jgi:hypothetical protein
MFVTRNVENRLMSMQPKVNPISSSLSLNGLRNPLIALYPLTLIPLLWNLCFYFNTTRSVSIDLSRSTVLGVAVGLLSECIEVLDVHVNPISRL